MINKLLRDATYGYICDLVEKIQSVYPLEHIGTSLGPSTISIVATFDGVATFEGMSNTHLSICIDFQYNTFIHGGVHVFTADDLFNRILTIFITAWPRSEETLRGMSNQS